MRVLLADDDEDIRELTTQPLRSTRLGGRHGHQRAGGRRGPGQPSRYDVAVLDQNMPPGSGLEAAAARRDAGDTIPIILWTGWGGTIDRAEAARLDVQVVNKAEVTGLVDGPSPRSSDSK